MSICVKTVWGCCSWTTARTSRARIPTLRLVDSIVALIAVVSLLWEGWADGPMLRPWLCWLCSGFECRRKSHLSSSNASATTIHLQPHFRDFRCRIPTPSVGLGSPNRSHWNEYLSFRPLYE